MSPAADLLTFHVVSEDLTPRITGSEARPTAASQEAARIRLLIRALEQELEQVEIASDYASYVSTRAARLNAVDDSYRWGLETARGRNFDAAYARLQETTAGAQNRAEAERARIRVEIAESRAKEQALGNRKETGSPIYTASGTVQIKATFAGKNVPFCIKDDRVYFQGFDEEDVRTKVKATQSSFLSSTLNSKYRNCARELNFLLDGLTAKRDDPAEMAAVKFAKERSADNLNAFLRALP